MAEVSGAFCRRSSRVEHTRAKVLPSDGQRVEIFYTKPGDHLLRPLAAAAGRPQAPPALRQALAVIDHHVGDYITRA